MRDVIYRDDAIEAVCDLPTWYGDAGCLPFGDPQPPMEALMCPEDVVSAISNLPSADVEPVRHGRWIPYERGDYHWHKCSACGVADKYIETDLSREIDLESVRNYCPNCGARVDASNPADKWFLSAYENTPGDVMGDGTYEAVGPHFQGNPYSLEKDKLWKHGIVELENLPRSFEGIKTYLSATPIEGIVFWRDGEPMCKIKRSDFGFSWPLVRGK